MTKSFKSLVKYN